ncbi:hypothetical protein DRQ09_07545, partial [candidate division KSB1 bacterium]
QKIFLFSFVFLIFLFSSVTGVTAQEPEGEVIIIHKKVGREIDWQENKKYNLFPGKKGFKSAVFIKKPDGSYILKIIYIDEKTGKEKVDIIPRTESKIKYYRKRIEQIEEKLATVSISLKNGKTLKGKIVSKEDSVIKIITKDNLEISVPESLIVSIKRAGEKTRSTVYYNTDPNYSRLMFAPTGRPLRKGEGYFSDYYLFFPGISYGFTGNISIMAGFSVFPMLKLKNQMKYIAPRIGKQISDNLAISFGTLFVITGLNMEDEGEPFGVLFSVGTYGQQDKSFTVGIGIPYYKRVIKNYDWYGKLIEEESYWKFGDGSMVIMLGGNVRISNSLAIVSENWLVINKESRLNYQPFGISLRFLENT